MQMLMQKVQPKKKNRLILIELKNGYIHFEKMHKNKILRFDRAGTLTLMKTYKTNFMTIPFCSRIMFWCG